MFFSFLKKYIIEHWRYLLRHWFLLVLFAMILAFIANLFGQSFGVPLLFRDDPAYAYEHQISFWSLNGVSITAYTAATVLLVAILAVVYITEVIGEGETQTRGRTVRETAIFFAIAGAIPLALMLVAAAWPSITSGPPPCAGDNTNCTPSDAAVIDAYGASWLFSMLREAGKALIGILIGGLIAFVWGYAIFKASRFFEDRRDMFSPAFRWLGPVLSTKAREEYPIVLGTLSTLIALGLLYFAATAAGISLAAIARPGAAICILFGVIVIFYFFILLLAPALRFIGVIGFLAFHAFVGADRYINELPGFQSSNGIDYYDCLLPLDKEGAVLHPKKRKACPGEAAAEARPAAEVNEEKPRLLTAEKWIGNWSDLGKDGAPKKLVVITTQGGAYRATFWTSLILDELAKRDRPDALHGLIDQVGLLTGASGGMVASAYFAAMSAEAGRTKDPWYGDAAQDGCGMNRRNAEGVYDTTWHFGPVTSRICRDVFETNHDKESEKAKGEAITDIKTKFPTPRPIARDSLTPLAAQTVLYDMRRVLSWPATAIPGFDALDWDGEDYLDRGVVLERQWKTLSTSYGELADQQENFKRHPSMIISPMIVDTGQPLLISNLDLSEMVNGSGEAVSLFEWFPDIQDDFNIQTAVRLNASFPYISPAVSLPTTARRRVVDAGYYDNFGVNTALAWLFQEDVVDFLAGPDIDQLIIIEIRAFKGNDFGKQEKDSKAWATAADARSERRKEPHQPDVPLIPEWLTSPLTGVLTARSGSMAYRNDAQIERLKKVVDAEAKSRGIDKEVSVERIVFENHAATDEVGVSWHITPKEMATLEKELKSRQNDEQFKKLHELWNRNANEDQSTDQTAENSN